MIWPSGSPNAVTASPNECQRPRVVMVFFLTLAERRLLASLAINESIRRSRRLTRRRDTSNLLATCSTVGIGAVSTVLRVCPMAPEYWHEHRSVNVH